MKEEYLNKVDSFKLKRKTKETLKKQIELFYSQENVENKANHKNNRKLIKRAYMPVFYCFEI